VQRCWWGCCLVSQYVSRLLRFISEAISDEIKNETKTRRDRRNNQMKNIDARHKRSFDRILIAPKEKKTFFIAF
jgi:hypothetical protein